MAFGIDAGGGGLFFLVFFGLAILFWGGLIALIFLAIRWLLRQNAKDHRDASAADGPALELLRQRYARGEIDAAEFEERKRILGG